MNKIKQGLAKKNAFIQKRVLNLKTKTKIKVLHFFLRLSIMAKQKQFMKKIK